MISLLNKLAALPFAGEKVLHKFDHWEGGDPSELKLSPWSPSSSSVEWIREENNIN